MTARTSAPATLHSNSTPIAFDAETDTGSQAFVVDVAPGAVPAPIGDIALHGLRPAWSPDGEWLALRGGVEIDQQALYVMQPNGSGLRRISEAARAVQPWCGLSITTGAAGSLVPVLVTAGSATSGME